MATLRNVTNFIDELLKVEQFKDYAPNGLQVDGKGKLKKIVTGVSATQALIEAAVDAQSDMLLVHHGWFWKQEDPCISGMKYRRLKLLMDNDISLLGYHLPLDAHPEFGNNAQLASRLAIHVEDVMDEQGVGNYGRLDEYISLEKLGDRIERSLGRKPLLISGGDHAIKKVAWCTGGAQDRIDVAAQKGVDAYISGEISEHTVHVARELGIHYIAAGHHATERYGVKALGEFVAAKFGLDCEFIDIDNPV